MGQTATWTVAGRGTEIKQGRERKRTGLVVLAACVAAALLAASAQATVPPSLHSLSATPATPGTGCVRGDAADGETTTNVLLPYWLCDDGVPNFDPLPGPGGVIANEQGLVKGAKAVTVPARYDSGGTTYSQLPAKAANAAMTPGADTDGNIALDVDVSIPDAAPPLGGYPMVVMMHGCCSGSKASWERTTVDSGDERWHYNNSWFASRGYVVVTYTSRGFVSSGRGSTGQTQLDSRSYEINDFQALACNVLDNVNSGNFDDVNGKTNSVNANRVVATGGSYGGGFSWMALTDPKWTCNTDTGANGTAMSLAAVAPKYGWTDLGYTLVPNGLHSLAGTMPAIDGCLTGPKDLDGAACATPAPLGVPKTSILTGLYVTGLAGATFTPQITNAFNCLTGPYPPNEANPACAETINTTLPEFLRERSAYYQNDWFSNMDTEASYRVPIFNAATLTDPLFPPVENRRMAERILATEPNYPIKQYYGDYQHFVQNKAKEWGDLCGGVEHHVCNYGDYPGGALNMDPTGLFRTGVTTRLNKFIDNYALPSGGYGAVPGNVTQDVTASLQICPENAAAEGVAADEPGPTFNAATFGALAPNTLTLDMQGAQTTTNDAEPNSHAARADPVTNSLGNGGRCPSETTVAEPGIASYTSGALMADATMIGPAEVTIDFGLSGPSDGLQLNARLYDVLPSGTAVMVDRGTRRVTSMEATMGEVAFGLHGNAWRFRAGHRVRIEIAQDDATFVRQTDIPSSTSLLGALIEAPIVEADQMGTGTPDEKPPPTPIPTSPSATPSSPPASKPAAKCKKKKKKKGAAAAKCKKKKKK